MSEVPLPPDAVKPLAPEPVEAPKPAGLKEVVATSKDLAGKVLDYAKQNGVRRTFDELIRFPRQRKGYEERLQNLKVQPIRESDPVAGIDTFAAVNAGVGNEMQYEQPVEGVLQPGTELADLVQNGLDAKVTPELVHASTHPEKVKVSDGQEEQDITAGFLGWKKEWHQDGVPEDQKVWVALPGIGTELNGTEFSVHAQKLAGLTGMPVMAMELPPFGGTDKLTAKQMQELSTVGTAHELARNLMRAMVGKGLKHVALEGYSMGGFMAAEIARVATEPEFKDSGLVIDNLIMLEPPGVSEIPIKDMSKSFFGEAKMQGAYRSAPYDYGARVAGSEAVTAPTKAVKGVKWLVENKLFRDRKNLMGKAMSHEVTPANMQLALEGNPDMLAGWAHATLSGISPAEGNKAMYDGLAAKYKDRIGRQAFSGDTHSRFLNVDAQTWDVVRMYKQQEAKRPKVTPLKQAA